MLSRQVLLRSARAAAPSRAIASQVRFYAAAPAANETVKPPVALFGLDGTYATALVRHRVAIWLRRRQSWRVSVWRGWPIGPREKAEKEGSDARREGETERG